MRRPLSPGQRIPRQRREVRLPTWPLDDPPLEPVAELYSVPPTSGAKPAGGNTQPAVNAAERAPDIEWPPVGILN
jgi:hypothetical protein